MLSHKITSADGKKTKTVSEFAWRRKYQSKGWTIVDTKGKATEASQAPALPPTQFQPPAVVVLRAGVASAAPKEKPVDPVGMSEVITIVADEKDTIINGGNPDPAAEWNVESLVDGGVVKSPKPKGRPKGSTNKVKATA